MDRVFRLATSRLVPFKVAGVMQLGGRTIDNLELVANDMDQTVHGSLLWVLDRTKTHPGRRLLRKWITRPLTSREYVSRAMHRLVSLPGMHHRPVPALQVH